jgi:hypothetical protein
MRGMHVRRTVALTLIGAMSQGCSFLFTRAPQPNGQPSPSCTTSYAAPITDTIVTGVSVAAVLAGSIVYANAHQCRTASCTEGNELAGTTAIVAGSVGALLFTPSTILGYTRVSACRAWFDGDDPARPRHPADLQLSLLVSPPRCSYGGDAPLLCSSRVLLGNGP